MAYALRACALTVGLAAAACTVDSDQGMTSLGSGTTVSTTAPTTTVSTSVSTSVSTTASTTDDTADTGATTLGDATESDTGSGASATSEAEAETTAGAQPTDGPYSACADATDCPGQVYCVTLQGEGFCSSSCMIPGDCAPSPAGTAQPICSTAVINMVEQMVCALDCSGGKTCPGGMECMPLGADMVCV